MHLYTDASIYRLPDINNNFSLIYETMDEAGQSSNYLVILNKDGAIVSHLILYFHKELDSASEGEYRDFEVQDGYKISIQDVHYIGDRKDIKESTYRIKQEGIIYKAPN